jgi:hypothetical protein
VGLAEEKYIFVPSYDSPEHTQNRRRALATNAATLVDPAQPAVPLEHVEVSVVVGVCVYCALIGRSILNTPTLSWSDMHPIDYHPRDRKKQYGKTYKLHLENFPAARALQVDLIKFHVRLILYIYVCICMPHGGFARWVAHLAAPP